MPGSTARAQLNAPLTWTLRIDCHTEGSCSTTGARFWFPALLTSTSGAQPASDRPSAPSCTAPGSDTSNTTPRASMPWDCNAATASLQGSGRTSLTMMRAPALPACVAIQRPSPEAPPVISTVRPSRPNVEAKNCWSMTVSFDSGYSTQGLHACADIHVLPGDTAAGARRQEKRSAGDVGHGHCPVQSHVLQYFGAHIRVRDPAQPGLGPDHLVHSFAFDDARQYRVDRDVMLAQFDSKALGQPDDRPLRRRIGRAHGIAQASRDRADIDDGRSAGLSQRLDSAAYAQKLAAYIDRHGAIPFGHVQVLQRRRRPGDAGIVDQHIQATELRQRVRKPGFYIRLRSRIC